jgi:hypothetical protein
MKLTNQTTLQTNLLKIENTAKDFLRTVVAATQSLNNSYYSLWKLPDDQLTEVLQHLLNEGKLEDVFTKHYIAATSLNNILDGGEYVGVRAIAIAGREFEISEEGVLTVVPLPIPEVVEENIDQILNNISE